MNNTKYKSIILSALRQTRGDDLERAKIAFRNYSPEEMKEQHGLSGKTRAEVLKEYQDFADAIKETADWVNKL